MSAKTRLKPGWRTCRFDRIATNVNERVDDPSEAGVDYYVGLEHLDSDTLTIRRWGSPSDVQATKLRFRSGDIIFGRRRVYQRKLGVAHFDGICSAHAMVLRAKPDVALPEFLPFFMQSEMFMERAKAISVGSLSPTINWPALAREEFSLPPLDEQRRIGEMLGAANATTECLMSVGNTLAVLLESFLIEHFGEMARDSAVKKVPVGRAGEVLMGRQRSPVNEKGPQMRPYLRVANVFDGYIDTRDVKQMHFSDEEFMRFQLRPGDVLLNEGQSRELVGRSAIFRGEVPGACFQNTLIRFRPGIDVTSNYAHLYFRYCLYTGMFAALAKQTTSIAHLGASRFAEMSMPIPPLDIQASATAMVSAIDKQRHASLERASAIRALTGRLSSISMLDGREL